jgi:hypothetical protein
VGAASLVGDLAHAGLAKAFSLGGGIDGVAGTVSLVGDGDRPRFAKGFALGGAREGVVAGALFVEPPRGFCGVNEKGVLVASREALRDGYSTVVLVPFCAALSSCVGC